jgi:hypothetical protein
LDDETVAGGEAKAAGVEHGVDDWVGVEVDDLDLEAVGGRAGRRRRRGGRSQCRWGLTSVASRALLLGECGRRGTGSVKNVVTALRALLRFLHLRGHIPVRLADAV